MSHKILLLTAGAESSTLLKQSLQILGHQIVAEATANDEVTACVEAVAPDILVIDCDSPGDALLNRLRELSQYRPLPVVMFTGDNNRSAIQKAVRAGVSAYIVDGLEQNRLGTILDVALARFQETGRLRQELAETRASLGERKNVDRAKGILMKQRGFDEAAAYHALRKMAMDKNLRIGQVAENVIAVAELLK